tara:strand:+ start:330 stop:749 length:420 start_codon:yes stop_codon:yes gene_type:complete
MKKMIFLAILFLSLQGISQIGTGVYQSSESIDYEWSNGEQTGDVYIYSEPMFIHISETGFRVYMNQWETGMSYPFIYMGKSSDGYYVYAVPFGDKLEINEDVAVLFYNFNNTTGWYDSSREWRGLEYISNTPILDYEKE